MSGQDLVNDWAVAVPCSTVVPLPSTNMRCSKLAWTGGGDGAQLPLFDHPLASIVQVPRTAEEIAALAGIGLRDARAMLLELEDDGMVLHAHDGTWISADLDT